MTVSSGLATQRSWADRVKEQSPHSRHSYRARCRQSKWPFETTTLRANGDREPVE